jgi:signal transduction histidine kinase
LIALDATQLERALVNLIKNGIEAANASSSNKTVLVKARLSGEEVSISVEDSGAGLGREPEDVLTSLRSTKPHGTGLGLFVSKKIIEAHRGRLVAGSSSGLKGAVFEVTLPVAGSRL